MGDRNTEGPTVIGRYALFDPIAAGGMAAVHFGLHLGPGGFSRTVALKRLHPSFAEQPDFVAMLLDEARLAARVRHPNVVPVIDVVEAGKELLLVMEYVQGESLAKILRAVRANAERIPVRIATTILGDVLEGLHAAHEATNEDGEPLCIVHRDVSPQNVMVGVDGVARAVDFGIAKAAQRLQVTQGDQIKGKLGYLAPEQLEHEPTDRRVDLWACSVVLWETLAARRLYDDERPGDTVRRVLSGEVLPLSDYVPELPAGLEALILRGLSREPKDRFSTARQMSQELESLVPRVTPRELGAWVQSVAGEALAARSSRLRQIEAQYAKREAIVESAAAGPGSGDGEPTPTQSAVIAATRKRQVRAGWFALALCGVLCVCLGVVLALLLRKPTTRVEETATAYEEQDAALVRDREPQGAQVLIPSSAASESAPAAQPSGIPTATKKRLPPVPAVPKGGCNPPYTIDKQGVRVPKPQCYR